MKLEDSLKCTLFKEINGSIDLKACIFYFFFLKENSKIYILNDPLIKFLISFDKTSFYKTSCFS